MIESIVIVGGGQAAVQAIDTLRRRGYTGKIALVGEENRWPYQRPPLSKAYLDGSLDPTRLLLRAPLFFEQHAVEGFLDHRVEAIDRAARQVRLSDGTSLIYDALLLATGGRARTLAVPGAELRGIHTLRTIADADRFRNGISAGRRLVIAGGGYIGLEVAATARKRGIHVTVLEMATRLMSRVVCGEVSAWFAALHASHGVVLALNAEVAGFTGDESGQVRGVRCADGSEHPADVVLVGAGVVQADELARDCGLSCNNGIVVDEYCRTSDPCIYAAGDCTNFPSVRYGRRVRLESVDNATEQATSAALNMMGIATIHDKVPWFWSDQYDAKLIIIGLCDGHDESVLRGNPESGKFTMCYLRERELIAVDTVNNAKDQMAARKLIAARVNLDPGKLADATRPLAECA